AARKIASLAAFSAPSRSTGTTAMIPSATAPPRPMPFQGNEGRWGRSRIDVAGLVALLAAAQTSAEDDVGHAVRNRQRGRRSQEIERIAARIGCPHRHDFALRWA